METTPPGIGVRVAVFDDGVAGHGEGFGFARAFGIHREGARGAQWRQAKNRGAA